MTRSLMLASLLQTNHVAGFKLGDSYEAMVARLGNARHEPEAGTPYWGYTYGDLEIWFDERCRASHLIYLNQSGNDYIRVRSHLPFRSQGLKWGISPGAFSDWACRNKVPFGYRPDAKKEAMTESIYWSLSEPGIIGSALFSLDEDGSYKLCKIFLGIAPAWKDAASGQAL